LEQARQEAEETRKEAAALADALAAELDKAQADIAALREQLAASLAKHEQQQAIINQETAAAIESKHRVELAEVARAELKTRADQLSELLKEEQATHKATHTALREQLAVSIAKQERQQAIIDQETAAAIESKHRVAEIKTRADQFSELLKEEQTAHKATRAALEKSQAEKSRLDGMLTVYESIGGSGKQAEVEPSAVKTPRKSKKTLTGEKVS
jgi:chromosome segregation ATPase